MERDALDGIPELVAIGGASGDRSVAAPPPADRILAWSPDVTVCTDTDRTIVSVSSGGAPWFGWAPHELIGRDSDDLVDVDDLPLVRLSRRHRDGGPFFVTFRLVCPDGSRPWVELAGRRVVWEGRHLMIGVLRDLTGRVDANMLTDPLTGLPNRAMLMDRLRAALQRQARNATRVAVLFVDLDRFKAVNDAYGHSVGDSVLVELATRLAAALRPADTLARLGGDEFVVVAEDVGPDSDALDLAERLLLVGREPVMVAGDALTCTLSIGVAVTRRQAQRPESVLQEADLALYRAKAAGRDRIEHFDDSSRSRRVSRRAMADVLRTAIAEEHLQVDYQGVVGLTGGEVDGAEALVRVVGPGGSRLLPAEFLGVAEEHGLLAAIEDWVLMTVLDQVVAWERVGGPATVTVNLTARTLADSHFARRAIEELARRQLPPGALQAEVGEETLMRAAGPGLIGHRLLREAGIAIGMDDFDFGSMSLRQLRNQPIDFLKLSASLTAPIEAGGRGRARVGALIGLAHALDLSVTAKGVETPGQLEVLRSLGCDRAQGFALGSPGPAAALTPPP